MFTVNEKSGFEFTASFTDADGNPTPPTTAHWRVYCTSTDKALTDWAEQPVVSATGIDGITTYTITVPVPGYVNALQNSRNTRETKNLLVVADKDLSTEWSQELSYIVNAVKGRL